MSLKYKNVYFSILIFLIISSSFYLPSTYLKDRNQISWQIADWMINYESGFVRRGLFGELTRLASKFLKIDQISLVVALQILIYLTFLIFLFILVIKSNFNFNFLILFASPGFILFNLYDLNGAYRKEIIFFCFFTIFLTLTLFISEKFLVLLNIFNLTIFVFAILSHELIALLCGFILISNWLLYRENKLSLKKLKILSYCYLISAFSTFTVSLIFRGDEKSAIEICNSITLVGDKKIFCSGSIYFLGLPTSDTLLEVKNFLLLPGFLSTYFLATLLILLPFLILFRFSEKLNKYLILSILFFIPIFFVAFDYGRWIYIINTTVSLIIFRFAGGYDIQVRSLSAHYHRITVAIFTVLFLSSWSIPHCCTNYLGGGLIKFVSDYFFSA